VRVLATAASTACGHQGQDFLLRSSAFHEPVPDREKGRKLYEAENISEPGGRGWTGRCGNTSLASAPKASLHPVREQNFARFRRIGHETRRTISQAIKANGFIFVASDGARPEDWSGN